MKEFSSPMIIKLLDVILPKDLHHLIGDLEEEYHLNKRREGRAYAYLSLWSQVLRSIPYFILQSLIWNTVMILNYLKVTWRSIKKHKSFSLINILGLAASMSVCLLIMLFIIDQRSYDRFHEHADRIYRVNSDFKSGSNNEPFLYATSPADLADRLEQEFPAVEEAVRIRGGYSGEIKVEDKTFNLEGLFTDGDFFQIFDFELIKGDSQTALKEPGSIVLSPESAKKLFGDVEPMGIVITGLGDRDYTVTGIINNDVKTHFRFEALVSYSTLTSKPELAGSLSNWENNIYQSYTYFQINEKANLENLSSQFPSLISRHYQDDDGENIISSFVLQPLTKINLGPFISNEIGNAIPGIIAWFLIGFALIIILIACFNYVSLTVAKALNRGKEVGVRKVLGAFRSNVIKQFLTESVVISVLALIFSVLILKWLLPQFNSLFIINASENQIDLSLINYYWVYIIFLMFSVFVGILAGIYPAVYLSSFQPSKVLKGVSSIKGLSAVAIRKTIIVSQFTFSLVFIITAIILFKQFNYMVNVDHGFNTEHIINVALQDVSYDRFENKYANHTDVVSIAASSKVPALGSITGAWMKTDSLTERIRGHYFGVDENYISTMGLNLLAGRNFNSEIGSDSTNAVILGKSAVRKLGLVSPTEAIGIPVEIDEESYTTIGVVDDFISADPLRSGDPIFMRYNPENFYYAVVKVKAGETVSFANYLESTWLDLNSVYSLKYKIFNDQLQESPMLVIFGDFLKVLGLIAVFSILISCLGLLGMAMYSAENRIKEIGIRKVLGASVSNIVYLLSKEYLLLVGIAVVIGAPLAWFINNLWLQAVSNKTDIGPVIFIAGVLGTVLLAMLTIGSQTMRAARANSIQNLQSE
ncbi:MAG: ABC transporter permease [Candidatus Halalkalibacterium sp. M3_1C_030]